MCIVQVNFSIFLYVIFFKIYNTQADVVFDLEEAENKWLNVLLSWELQAAIAWIVHVDRTDSRGNHLDDL